MEEVVSNRTRSFILQNPNYARKFLQEGGLPRATGSCELLHPFSRSSLTCGQNKVLAASKLPCILQKHWFVSWVMTPDSAFPQLSLVTGIAKASGDPDKVGGTSTKYSFRFLLHFWTVTHHTALCSLDRECVALGEERMQSHYFSFPVFRHEVKISHVVVECQSFLL